MWSLPRRPCLVLPVPNVTRPLGSSALAGLLVCRPNLPLLYSLLSLSKDVPCCHALRLLTLWKLPRLHSNHLTGKEGVIPSLSLDRYYHSCLYTAILSSSLPLGLDHSFLSWYIATSQRHCANAIRSLWLYHIWCYQESMFVPHNNDPYLSHCGILYWRATGG